MIRDVLKMGDSRLLQVSAPVLEFDTPELHALLADMRDTMAHLNGAGIAAPQIGVNQQVVIFGSRLNLSNPRYPDVPEIPETVLINPVIEPIGDEEALGWEGCLSVPGMRGLVPRAKRLHYRGFDEQGQIIDRIVEDFHARVVQHEVDHLLGILYPQRIRDLSQFGFIDALFPGQDIEED